MLIIQIKLAQFRDILFSNCSFKPYTLVGFYNNLPIKHGIFCLFPFPLNKLMDAPFQFVVLIFLALPIPLFLQEEDHDSSRCLGRLKEMKSQGDSENRNRRVVVPFEASKITALRKRWRLEWKNWLCRLVELWVMWPQLKFQFSSTLT